MEPLKMRPHHSVCLHFFVGKGYSDAFVENMSDIKHALEKDGGLRVAVTDGGDGFCAACPDGVKAACAKDGKAAEYDEKCLAALGLGFGDTVTWETLCSLAEKKILRCEGARRSICGGCRWDAVCQHAYVENLSKALKTV